MKRTMRCAAVALIALMVAHTSFGQDNGLRIESEIILARGEPFDPTSITVLPDAHLLVTGSGDAKSTGIGIKMTQAGEIAWTYQAQKTQIGQRLFGIFRGTIPLASGDILICGNDYVPKESSPRGGDIPRLIRLDAAGNFVSSAHLTPPISAVIFNPRVDGCGRWGEGAFVYGHVFDLTRNPALPNSNERAMFLWVVRLDGRGEVIWQKLFSSEDTEIVGRAVRHGDDLSSAPDGITGRHVPQAEHWWWCHRTVR